MQIKDSRKKYNTSFELIGIGEVFSWEGEFWMRTRHCKVNDTLCNVVNIADGTFTCFENFDRVEKLDTELTIR